MHHFEISRPCRNFCYLFMVTKWHITKTQPIQRPKRSGHSAPAFKFKSSSFLGHCYHVRTIIGRTVKMASVKKQRDIKVFHFGILRNLQHHIIIFKRSLGRKRKDFCEYGLANQVPIRNIIALPQSGIGTKSGRTKIMMP